jgi:tetratricopeptide (TPR) repeat protein
MNRDQVRFLLSGILFGFLVGYVIAYAVHEPRVKQSAAPVPGAGNLGMSPGGIIGAGAPAAAARDQMMERVFQEIAALRAAIEKDPQNVDALVRLANMYYDSGKCAEAIEYYGKALEFRPDDVNVRTDMGICMRELGRPDEALEQFRGSLSRAPDHWQTWLNLGIVSLFDKHDTASAAEAFAKVEELNPGFKDLPFLKEAVRKAAQGTPPGSS